MRSNTNQQLTLLLTPKELKELSLEKVKHYLV